VGRPSLRILDPTRQRGRSLAARHPIDIPSPTEDPTEDLLAVRKIAVPGAIAQITVATLLGMAVAHWWGWRVGAGLVFGLALSVASIVVLLRALESRGLLDSINGGIAVGWLHARPLSRAQDDGNRPHAEADHRHRSAHAQR
jgi:Sodium/hydrogen exchanger family